MDDVTSVTRPTSPAPGVPAYDLFDLLGGWKINDKVSIRAGITNLFNADPVMVAGTPGLTQPGTYDIIGRSYFLSVSAGF